MRPCGCSHIALLTGEEVNVPTGVGVSLGPCSEVNPPLIRACAGSRLEPLWGSLCWGFVRLRRGLKGC